MNITNNRFFNLKFNKIQCLKEKLSNIFLRSPKKDVFESNTIDIHSKGKFPSNVLSNFHVSNFKFDNISISSMEGFLQSLKTSDEILQKRICKLIGIDAKNAGNELLETYDKKTLHWQGQKIDRFSEQYQDLLKRVYKAKFDQDPLFRDAIASCENKNLIHTIGKSSKEETILTEEEFVTLLNWLKQFLK